MKPKTRVLLERFIRDGIEHAVMNTEVEVPSTIGRLVDEIDNRIWLYIDEYFTFED